MKDLKEVLEKLGFKNVRTYIQSGNVVFNARKELPHSEIEHLIETAIADKYDFRVIVIVRTSEQLLKAITKNPFDPVEDIKKNYLVFLKEKPDPELVAQLAKTDCPDEFRVMDDHIYLKYSTSYSDSKLSNNFFENKLQVEASTRNWKTLTRLMEMSEAD